MPARKPLPSVEAEICGRVRKVREAARMSRPSFGRLLSLDSSKVSNIEHVRVPVDYITGLALCRIFHVSPGWLVTGDGPPTQVLPASVFAPVPGATARTLFSDVYRSDLRARVEHAEATRVEQTSAVGERFMQRASQEGATSPTELGRIWMEEVLATGSAERAEVEAVLARAVFGRPYNAVEFQNELEIVSGFDDKKTQMHKVVAPSDLMDQVKNATTERGAKTALAKRLGVSRQRLNEWLSGRSQPSGRYVLLLLNQLNALRRRQRVPTSSVTQQRNRAATASTEAALQTQHQKSTSHEKRKSSQQNT